ncbi:MAG: Phosphoglycerate kinase [Bacteroidetes bacterium 38_7]|nr:MAG: Phosphoglycerate kinase [Bacteroidetes bacterium 38_7]
MKTIDDFNFKNKRALIRVDFNVPLDDKFQITDTTRIDATIPTIRKILNDGGCVILMSHLGRPKDGPSDKYSLRHLLPYLRKVTGVEVKFAPDCIGQDTLKMASELKPGEILLLENLRFYKEEEKGDEEFAGKLAKLGDVYVNDAFGTAHRAHASTAIIAKFFPQAKMFGYVMGNELAALKKVLEEAERPFTAILGGAKVSGKIEIIRNLMQRVDNLIIGGGMMYTFIKAQGGKVGNSLVEDELIPVALETLEKAKQLGINILLPVDVVIADKFDNEANRKICKSDEIPDGWIGLDIGPKTIELFKDVIIHSKTLLWNGPMGVFEMSNFETGTVAVAQCIAEATTKGAYSLVGGGDSVAAINKYQLANQVSYVSTGGGAMLEYIEGKELPGVKFINE